MKFLIYFLCLVLFVIAKKGGGGRGGGTSSGSTASGGTIKSGEGDAENGEVAEEDSIMPAVRVTVSTILLICFVLGMGVYLFFTLRKCFRKKKDIEKFLGVALARIHKVDAEADDQRVRMGVGLDQRNINEWIEDIWESFDRDGNGSIDKFEIRGFID